MIREYELADCEAVVHVWGRASAVAHPFLGREFLESERRAIPDVYLPQADTWVWETNGRVVGFMSLLGNEIGALFVDPELHRSGIGRAFVDRARELHGALEVDVFVKNEMGRAFYERMGFEPVARRAHEESGFDILRMRLAASVR